MRKAATPGQASATGAILGIMHPIGGERFAAHVFDIVDGIAIMDHGWADAYPGGGQPCHIVEGDFEPYDEDSWIAMGTELGDIIFTYYGSEQPDGTRDRARTVVEQALNISVPG